MKKNCLKLSPLIVTLLLLSAAPAAFCAEEKGTGNHVLSPLDLSSPRATLTSFLETGDNTLRVMKEGHWKNPTRASVQSIRSYAIAGESALDLSEIAPASRFDIGRDGCVYLYEVLCRIELPPANEIPDANAFALGDHSENSPASWTIPHTEITLTRMTSGPKAGCFLFSSSTVKRAEEFYEKTQHLPYRRTVPIENFAEMRVYMTPSGWLLSPHFISRFPAWLKHGIYQQAIWKWLALLLLILVNIFVVIFVHRFSRRNISDNSTASWLQRLATPLTLLCVTPFLLNQAIRQLTLTGTVSEGIKFTAEFIKYISLAWLCLTGSMVAAAGIISSPKIKDESLNAHLLRLCARCIGIAAVTGIVFHLSSRLGAPLYSLFTGLGIGGIAVALAAKNSIENFIGSLNLFADSPVRVGDLCRYGEDPSLQWQRMGTVESIGLRSTKIRGVDHSLTTIPNADFSCMHIVNYSARESILFITVLGLRYETTEDQMRFLLAGLRTMLLAHPKVADTEPRVRFAGFGDYSLNVEIRVDINTGDMTKFREIREDLNLRIMEVVKDSGTGFAFPSSTVYHARDTGIDAERQQSAEQQVEEWRTGNELPFPHFSIDYRINNRNTLDYPPAGSPDAKQEKK